MCYYKLDYYDVSLEILAVYLQSHPESPIGVNLKACNHFRLYNGKAAEAELKFLAGKGVNTGSNELIRHNSVVFSNGEQALQVGGIKFIHSSASPGHWPLMISDAYFFKMFRRCVLF